MRSDVMTHAHLQDEIAALVRHDRGILNDVTANPAGAVALEIKINEPGATTLVVAAAPPQKPLLLALKMSLDDFPGGPDGDHAEIGKGSEEDDVALVAGELRNTNRQSLYSL